MLRSKARVLSCALAFVLLYLPAFSLSVSASSGGGGGSFYDYSTAPNLIDPSYWEVVDEDDAIGNFYYSWNSRLSQVEFRGNITSSTPLIIGSVITPSNFIAGHTYFVSFSVFSSDLTSESLVGVGILDGKSYSSIDYNTVEFSSSQFTGDISYSFVSEQTLTNPQFCFSFLSNQDFVVRLRNLRVIDVTAFETDEQTNKIGGFISELGNSLLDGIKSLFVPTDEDITDFKDTCSELFSDHLGILYDIGSILDEVVDFLGDILSNTTSRDGYITLPELEFELLGQDIHLWDETTITFDFIDEIAPLSLLYDLYKIMLNMIFIFLLFNYAERTFDEVFRV